MKTLRAANSFRPLRRAFSGAAGVKREVPPRRARGSTRMTTVSSVNQSGEK